MKNNTFTVKVGDQEKKLKTLSITPEIRLESNKFYSRSFNESLSSGVPLKIEVERILESKNLLDTKEEEKKMFNFRKELKDLEILLRKGVKDGVKMTKEQGKEVALLMRKKRAELSSVGQSLAGYFNQTVESYAENERLQFFVYACTVYADTGERYWKSYDLFKSDDTAVVSAASNSFIQVAIGLDDKYEDAFYETTWLKKQGFLNKDGKFVNSLGKVVDEEGRLLDADNRFINDFGQFIDIYGNPIDKDGNLLIEDAWNKDMADSPIKQDTN